MAGMTRADEAGHPRQSPVHARDKAMERQESIPGWRTDAMRLGSENLIDITKLRNCGQKRDPLAVQQYVEYSTTDFCPNRQKSNWSRAWSKREELIIYKNFEFQNRRKTPSNTLQGQPMIPSLSEKELQDEAQLFQKERFPPFHFPPPKLLTQLYTPKQRAKIPFGNDKPLK
jgi:hypothetical protein